MTQATTPQEIQNQIDIIRKANEAARQTKETALKFLIDAGILPPETLTPEMPKTQSKQR